MTYSPQGEASLPADIHAGDEIAVVAQARSPQMFRDEGAFDRPAYLGSHGVELNAALRSSQLLELETAANPAPHTALAHIRRRLRESIAHLLSGAKWPFCAPCCSAIAAFSIDQNPSISKDRCVSRSGCCRLARRSIRSISFFVLHGNSGFHVCDLSCRCSLRNRLRCRRGATSASSARSTHDARSSPRPGFLSARRAS